VSAVWIALIVLAIVGLLAVLLYLVNAVVAADHSDRILREATRVSDAIDDDHQAAKRAMNDAAGQSWRNLAE